MRQKLGTGAGKTWGVKAVLLPLLALWVCLAPAMPAHSQVNSPPAFSTNVAIRSITEHPSPYRPIGAPFVAEDPDPGDALTYSLSGKDAAVFHVVEGSGQLEATAPLDYEEGSNYFVTVRATDTGGLYDTVSVYINVEDVDEAGEVFLAPAVTNAGIEFNAFLRDPDGSYSGVSWQWDRSPNRIDWTTIVGADSASYMAETDDLSQFLRARATYTDGHGPGKMAEAIINGDSPLPEGNNTPEFPFYESGVRSVRGNALAGEEIGQPVIAADLDRDVLTYRLSGEASLLFDIEPYSGQLTSSRSLNHQLDGRYFGEVRVFDGRGGSNSKTVRIDVGDVPTSAAHPLTPIPPAQGETVPASTALTGGEGKAGQDAGAIASEISQTAGGLPPTTNQDHPSTQSHILEPTPAFRSGEATEPAAEKGPTAQHDDEPAIALAAVEFPPPSFPGEGTSTNSAGPSGGSEPMAPGESGWFGSFLAWAVGILLAALLLAVMLLLVWRLKRTRKREITLPPPTIGPERRLARPPIFLSPPRGEMGSGAGAD